MVSTRLLVLCDQFETAGLTNQILEQDACEHRISRFMVRAYILIMYEHIAFKVLQGFYAYAVSDQ